MNENKIFRLVSICLWLLPDVVMCLINIITFFILRKLTSSLDGFNVEDAEPTQAVSESESIEENTYSPEQYAILKRTCMICLNNEKSSTNEY